MKICSLRLKSPPVFKIHQLIDFLGSGVPGDAISQKASLFNQFFYLMNRAGKNAWRNKMIIQAKLLQNAIVGLLVGLIYYNVDDKSITTKIQVLFYNLINA